MTTEETLSPDEAASDTTINLRSVIIREDSVFARKQKKEYVWIKTLDSLLHDAQNKSNSSVKKYSPSFLDRVFNSVWLRVFLLLIAGGIVVYIISRLFLSTGIFRKPSKKITEQPEEAYEDSMAKDFGPMLRNAVAAGDLRLAMRYLFLQTMQKLNERGLIIFAADKTNSMYVNELSPLHKNTFATLALYYEYIWYGEAEVNKENFDAISTKFNDFIRKI